MRIHHLSIQAFGPFPDRVEVDFDDLSGAGLFLLSGATGAGKTSVLDAVCFALYGDVPGDRGTARRLRSDHAAPGLAPEVRLELTMSGRRFRLVRSPQWVRPKRRGEGVTTEQSKVVCEERRGGEWQALSTRLDETGHLITGLLGMNLAQFCQVAMLPQGQFQGFLRARSEERHTLLQRLFETDRFEQVEHQVRDRARVLGRESAEHAAALDRLLSRVLEAADTTFPPEWDGTARATLVEADAVSGWLTTLAEETCARAQDLDVAHLEADRLQVAARTRAEAGHRSAELRARGDRAATALASLQSAEEIQAERRDRLSAVRRAEPVLPLHRLVTAATAEVERAELRRDRALAEAFGAIDSFHGADALPVGGVGTHHALTPALAEIAAITARARALTPRQSELTRLVAESDQVATQLAQLRRTAEALAARVDDLPGAIDLVSDEISRERAIAETHATHQAEVALLTDVHAARLRLDARSATLAEVDARLEAARSRVVAAKEHWLDLREARITGMAAELAAGLAVGDDCPVCGSDHHPRPAALSSDAPTGQSEKEARALVDDAEFELHSIDSEQRDLVVEVTGLRDRAGNRSPEELSAALVTATAARDAAHRAATAISGAEGRLTALQQALTEAQRDHTRAETARATLTAQLDALTQRRDEIGVELDAVLAPTVFTDLDALVRSGDAVAAAGAAALVAGDALDAARTASSSAAETLTECLATQRFASVDDALAAALPDEQRRDLERAVQTHDAELATAQATLDEPEVAAALSGDSPDLKALDAELAERERQAAELRDASAQIGRRTRRLDALRTDLSDLLEVWAPVREAHVVAAELAALVEGKSADNVWRLRLSGYVLAWRLGQVVAAANERLTRMTDGRYLLEHSGHRSRRETRGGLSLLVRDEWSGEARDPATLSGGESFIVSLCLALGLADVVAHEVGGSQLDTLFIDEGFGALDAESLDGVMDTLDGLREGGRVVGVVSHVAEMRSRIPTQLVVTKDRDRGSSLRISRGQV